LTLHIFKNKRQTILIYLKWKITLIETRDSSKQMHLFFKTKEMKSSNEEIENILTKQNKISIETDGINEQQAKEVMT